MISASWCHRPLLGVLETLWNIDWNMSNSKHTDTGHHWEWCSIVQGPSTCWQVNYPPLLQVFLLLRSFLHIDVTPSLSTSAWTAKPQYSGWSHTWFLFQRLEERKVGRYFLGLGMYCLVKLPVDSLQALRTNPLPMVWTMLPGFQGGSPSTNCSSLVFSLRNWRKWEKHLYQANEDNPWVWLQWWR